MILSKKSVELTENKRIEKPGAEYFDFPEKVLQFGTGVLLRALPDYFIDKANKQGSFRGRVVIVKSTSAGTIDAFDKQDGLYTICLRGLENGNKVEENILNASISRVLSAKTAWPEILACAANPDIQVIISNTTEVGLVLAPDDLQATPPLTFPGKLLAFLLKRYAFFKGDKTKGMVIIPTELIPDNGKVLAAILQKMAAQNGLDKNFQDWLQDANHFCSSLVDRIVPGKLPDDQQLALEKDLGYEDELMIMSEPYCLWAIESAENEVKSVLSFSHAAPGMVIAPDIQVFRELKLRLLNGSHTFSCGYAYLLGIRTVKEAMDNAVIAKNIRQLLFKEIIPAITGKEITREAASQFAEKVLDRFSNPFIRHPWINITLQYCSKMKMRNIPILRSHYEKYTEPPPCMALGFAAHLLFMKSVKGEDSKFFGEVRGEKYPVNDEFAPYYSELWAKFDPDALVLSVLGNQSLWGTDLLALPGFAKEVSRQLHSLMDL